MNLDIETSGNYKTYTYNLSWKEFKELEEIVEETRNISSTLFNKTTTPAIAAFISLPTLFLLKNQAVDSKLPGLMCIVMSGLLATLVVSCCYKIKKSNKQIANFLKLSTEEDAAIIHGVAVGIRTSQIAPDQRAANEFTLEGDLGDKINVKFEFSASNLKPDSDFGKNIEQNSSLFNEKRQLATPRPRLFPALA